MQLCFLFFLKLYKRFIGYAVVWYNRQCMDMHGDWIASSCSWFIVFMFFLCFLCFSMLTKCRSKSLRDIPWASSTTSPQDVDRFGSSWRSPLDTSGVPGDFQVMTSACLLGSKLVTSAFKTWRALDALFGGRLWMKTKLFVLPSLPFLPLRLKVIT